MFQNTIILISVLMIVAMICQWTAWFLKLPALVLLCLGGIILGPVLGLLEPAEAFGENLTSFISLGVGVILFEGGLQLKFAELKKNPKSIMTMIFPGAAIGWGLIALGAHFIAGFSWPVSVFLGGLLVVTGPTVIIPMLRQVKPSSKVASVLKWEGIINDPIGALIAAISVTYLTHQSFQTHTLENAAMTTLYILIIVVQAIIIGKIATFMFRSGRVAEYLKAPMLLSVVIAAYVGGNYFQKEGGLIAVTILGIYMANAKSMRQVDMYKFMEYITLILVSLIFIILTATLKVSDLEAINLRMVLFVGALILLLRPISVLLSTIKTELNIKEKIFIGLIGPRGIVCIAVTSVYAPLLVDAGYEDAKLLIPCVFLLVFTTVIFSGFLMKPLGKILGVIPPQKNMLLIVGAEPFSVALAQALMAKEVPLVVMDNTWSHLKPIRQAGIKWEYGEVLSESEEYKFEIQNVTHVLAATDNFAYNSLVCSYFAHNLGEKNVMQLAAEKEESDIWSYQDDYRGKSLISEEWDIEKLQYYIAKGWIFIATKLTEQFSYEDYLEKNGRDTTIPIMTISEKEIFNFSIAGTKFQAKAGDLLVSFSSPREDKTNVTDN